MGRPRTYAVPAEWTLPDLTTNLPTGLQVESEVGALTTVHFDTGDRSLGRRGIRVSVHPDGCSVRLPDDEFTAATTSARAVPREVQGVLLGVRRGSRLSPIATTEVSRTIIRIVGVDGGVRACVTDEQTTATAFDDADVVDRRRTITLASSDDSLRATLHRTLVDSGAERCRPDRGSPEFVIALTNLGADAHAPKPGKRTIGRLVTDYLNQQHDALLHADVALRRGHDVVHSARIAIRRYRSALRVFADLVDAARAATLDAELHWYAAQLGTVRDPQVQRARLGHAVAALDPDIVFGPVAARIDESLHGEELKARVRLDRTMRGQRYLALLIELDAWRNEPPVTKRANRKQKSAASYLEHAERALSKRLRLASHSDEESLHRARRAAKRLRYAAELCRPALGQPARRTAARAEKLQTRLGEFVDSAVACEVLLRLGRATARVPDENGFTFGLLYEAEHERAARKRERALTAGR
jgi:CHAD domain-containing protein